MSGPSAFCRRERSERHLQSRISDRSRPLSCDRMSVTATSLSPVLFARSTVDWQTPRGRRIGPGVEFGATPAATRQHRPPSSEVLRNAVECSRKLVCATGGSRRDHRAESESGVFYWWQPICTARSIAVAPSCLWPIPAQILLASRSCQCPMSDVWNDQIGPRATRANRRPGEADALFECARQLGLGKTCDISELAVADPILQLRPTCSQTRRSAPGVTPPSTNRSGGVCRSSQASGSLKLDQPADAPQLGKRWSLSATSAAPRSGGFDRAFKREPSSQCARNGQ